MRQHFTWLAISLALAGCGARTPAGERPAVARGAAKAAVSASPVPTPGPSLNIPSWLQGSWSGPASETFVVTASNVSETGGTPADWAMLGSPYFEVGTDQDYEAAFATPQGDFVGHFVELPGSSAGFLAEWASGSDEQFSTPIVLTRPAS